MLRVGRCCIANRNCVSNLCVQQVSVIAFDSMGRESESEA